VVLKQSQIAIEQLVTACVGGKQTEVKMCFPWTNDDQSNWYGDGQHGDGEGDGQHGDGEGMDNNYMDDAGNSTRDGFKHGNTNGSGPILTQNK
jgi:hypothetical protein